MIDIRKLHDYCLNRQHRRGAHKARVFDAALGLSAADAEELREAIREAIEIEDAVSTTSDQYGQRYVVDFVMHRATGRSATIRTTWIVRHGEDFARLTSCYVL